MRMHDRSLVGADDVGSGIEGGAQVRDRGLSGLGVQRAGLEKGVGPGCGDPVLEVTAVWPSEKSPARSFPTENPLGAASQPRRRVATPVMR